MLEFINALRAMNLSGTSKKFFVLLTLLLMSACQSTRTIPPFPWPAGATVTQSQFKHMVVTQEKKNTPRLHVYIEGDGRPFNNRFQVATDPSPHYPLMLQLMEQDKTASLYLGRPCYFNQSNPQMIDEQCNFHWWTDARYSDAVVNSMINALRQNLKHYAFQGITLIGHSGGGTLAMLMAERMPEVDQLVTLAGNLDTQAWTRYHHYSSLNNSLNPAEQINIARPVKQIHFMGAKDDNVPPVLAQDFLAKISQQGKILEKADHNCCWQSQWPELLMEIDKQMQK